VPTVVVIAFAAFALLVALRRGGSPRGAFDMSRERLRADAHKPAKVATFYGLVAAFFALILVTDSANWPAALFALAFAFAFLTVVFWLARR